MPYKTPELAVSSSVVKWAISTAGYKPYDVVERLDISRELIQAWEKESEHIHLRVTQLEDLAHFLKRPLATFLLEKPPLEPAPPKDFRRAAGKSRPLSPDLRLMIRRSRRLQRVARELMESMGMSTTSEIPTAELRDEPKLVGKELRRSFGISTQEQIEWRSPWEALRKWRDALEKRNILVFQGGFTREEAQGFSNSDEHPFTIILSIEDHPHARNFTLFHELGHLLLGDPGVCKTELIYPVSKTRINRTENWCHRFAESFLIDDETLYSKESTQYIIRMDPDYEAELNKLSMQFKVSRAVILFRLLHDEKISDSSFQSMYLKLQQLPRPKRREKKTKWGPPPDQRALNERGGFLSRLVLESLDRNILGYADTADYLGVRPRHFDKIRLVAYG